MTIRQKKREGINQIGSNQDSVKRGAQQEPSGKGHGLPFVKVLGLVMPDVYSKKTIKRRLRFISLIKKRKGRKEEQA